jgi:hypothetical protein
MSTPLSVLGNGVAVDYTTNPADPILKIPYSAIAAAINWTTAPTAQTEKLDPWAQGFLQKLADFATNNPTNETNNIVVNQPTNNAPGTRNGVQNRKNSRYIATVWSTSTTNPVLDGDEL